MTLCETIADAAPPARSPGECHEERPGTVSTAPGNGRWALPAALAVLIIGIGVFGVSRIDSDYRWGGWATGDVENLNAALHFAREGFARHYFLPYNHPGHLGVHVGSETTIGYYTHYPPLSALINGAVARWWGHELWQFRLVSLAFSLGWLAFFFAFASRMFSRPLALAAVAVIAVSPGYLDYMDGFSPYTYSEFFVYGGLWLYLRSVSPQERHPWLCAWGAWAMMVLESLNSFDYIFFLFLFVFGHSLVFRQGRRVVFRLLGYGLAPICGLFLHLLQNAWLLGGLDTAWADITGATQNRLAGTGEGGYPALVLKLSEYMAYWMKANYRLAPWQVAVILGAGLVGIRALKPQSARFLKSLALMLAATVCWWFFAIHAATAFSQQMVRQIYPVLAILLAAMMVALVRFLRTGAAHPLIKVLAVGACGIVLSWPVQGTAKYLASYPNWVRPVRSWNVSDPQDTVIKTIELSKAIMPLTAWGDVVFVPDNFTWRVMPGLPPHPLYEYFSQRRLEYLGAGDEEFRARAQTVEDFVTKVLPTLDPPDAPVRFFAVLAPDQTWQRELLPDSPWDALPYGYRLVRLIRPIESPAAEGD